MKKVVVVLVQIFLFNFCLWGQIGMHPNVILLGSDTIPYGDEVVDTFQIFDLQKGGASFGVQFHNAWHRDSIGVGSFAAGAGSIASTDFGIALGIRSKVQGPGTGGVAIGSSVSSSGAFTFGSSCEAKGPGTMAIGFSSKAYGGEGSFATGYFTQSNGNSCAVVGRFNDTLVVKGNSATGSSDGPLFIIGNGDGFTNLSNAMVVRKNGKMGLGADSPAYRLHVKNTSGSAVIGLGASEGRAGMAFRENGMEVGSLSWRIDDQQFVLNHGSLIVFRAVGGKMGIGRSPSTNNLEVSGSASKDVAGNWVANSDRRIKRNIQNIENGLTTLLQLRPVKFKYSKEWLARNPNIKDQYYYNFIAQEFAEVFPESVNGSGEYLQSSDQEILQIDTYNAQIVNIKATQELAEKIHRLEKENSELRQEIDQLKNTFSRLLSELDN